MKKHGMNYTLYLLSVLFLFLIILDSSFALGPTGFKQINNKINQNITYYKHKINSTKKNISLSKVTSINKRIKKKLSNFKKNSKNLILRLKRLRKRLNSVYFKKLNSTYNQLNDSEKKYLGYLNTEKIKKLLLRGKREIRNYILTHKILKLEELNRLNKIRRTRSQINMFNYKIKMLNQRIHMDRVYLMKERLKLKLILHKGNKTEQINAVKDYLNKTILLLEHWLEIKKEKLNLLENANPVFINESNVLINNQINNLNQLLSRLQNATTKPELKKINHLMIDYWRKNFKINQFISTSIASKLVGNYIIRANVLKAKLNDALESAESNKINISFVDPIVADFNNEIEQAEQNYLQAENLLNSTMNSTTINKSIYLKIHEFLDKSRRQLWKANKDVVEIIFKLNRKRISLHFKNPTQIVINKRLISNINRSPFVSVIKRIINHTNNYKNDIIKNLKEINNGSNASQGNMSNVK